MRKNRILGVLLSVVMLVGMIPSTIFADNSTLPKSNKLDSAEKMAAAMPSLPSAVFTKSGKSNRLVIRTDSDISAYLQGAETLTSNFDKKAVRRQSRHGSPVYDM